MQTWSCNREKSDTSVLWKRRGEGPMGGATPLQRRRWPSGPWALLLLVPLGLLQEVEQAALLQELVAADVRCGAVQTNGVETHVGVPTFRADDPLNQGCDYLSLSVAKRASSVLFSANRLVS